MLKKYPFVKQSGIKDCGAACLLMIVKYYNGDISLENLRDLTKTSKNGTTAYHLIQAAKTLGFDAYGLKLNELNKDITLPVIASVTIDNKYKHFIVIYEINFKKKYLIIGDPANKIKKIKLDDFIKIWNNVVIVLTPLKPIPKITNDMSLYKFFINILLNNKRQIINILILSLILTFLSIVTSFYFKYMIDGINKKETYLMIIFMLFLSLHILKIITNYFRNIILINLNQNLDFTLTVDTFKNIVNLPYNYYRNRTTGEIVSRIKEVEMIRDTISNVFLTLFMDLPLTIISFVILYFVCNSLFFIAFIILVLYILIVIIFKPIFNNYIAKIQVQKASTTSYMIECISSYESIKGINNEVKITNSFVKKYLNYLKNIFKFENYYNLQSLFKELVNNIGLIIIILVGCLLVCKGEITLGTLLTFDALLTYFLEPIRNVVDLDTDIRETKIAFKRISEIICYHKDEGSLNQRLKGSIVFKNLSFTHNDRDIILKNINLNIPFKEKVMIIGKSGSGKSTLVKIIKGYYKVKRKKVYINDIDINDYKSSCLNKNVVCISQQENLFTDTLKNNILLERNISDSKFLDITKMCYVDEIINKNNTSYNLMIEENGFNLSGGERQRIVLARALLSDFDILIIDEGLNQMDINLERKILKNIFDRFQDKTIIVVSHRLENMDMFSKIVELKNGKIVKELDKNDK